MKKIKEKTFKKKCDIPNCHMDSLATSIFCGPHENAKVPKLIKFKVNGKEFYFTEEEFKKHPEFYEKKIINKNNEKLEKSSNT